VSALLDAARTVRTRAHAPYSGFRVGAALQTEDGRVFTGVNVEAAAFGAGLCAERVALGAAVAAGVREFSAIAVVGDGDRPCVPCGVCRQALVEFAPRLVVLAGGETGPPQRFVLDPDLLPHPFSR
jgi:cytidine deaminase